MTVFVSKVHSSNIDGHLRGAKSARNSQTTAQDRYISH